MTSPLLHPDLAGCRRLFLRGLELQANIGVHDHERHGAQRVVLDVDFFVDLADTTPAHDKIAEVLDYDFIHATIHRRVALGHINLLETLCDDVARELLDHPLARGVRVSVAKPHIYPEGAAIGVEVFHVRPRAGRESSPWPR